MGCSLRISNEIKHIFSVSFSFIQSGLKYVNVYQGYNLNDFVNAKYNKVCVFHYLFHHFQVFKHCVNNGFDDLEISFNTYIIAKLR